MCFKNTKDSGINVPCLACMYYNRSLYILFANLLPDDDKYDPIDNNSKSLMFLYAIESNELRTTDENIMSQVAYTLEAMGNITLSCAYYDENKKEGDKINFEKNGFITKLISLWKNDDTKIETLKAINDIKVSSQLEKSIIYFWTASKYHQKASNFKESQNCFVYIIRILDTYIRINNEKEYEEKNELCEALKKYIVKKAIMRAYSNREFKNMAEMQEIKWLYSREMYEDINLSQLSLIPDLEEVILAYYQIKLALLVKKGNAERDLSNEIKKLYRIMPMRSLRLDSTIYSRVLQFYFKTRLNRMVLERVISAYNYNIGTLEEYTSSIDKKEKDRKSNDNQIVFFFGIGNNKDEFDKSNNAENSISKFFADILADSDKINGIGKDFIDDVFDNKNDSIRGQLCLLEFLIKDSLFCLSEIIEILAPTSNSTLFTNSFIANTYRDMQMWNKLYESLFLFYRCFKKKSINESKIFQKKYRPMVKIVDKYIKDENYNIAEEFFSEVIELIGKYNIHYTNNNYLAEMAIKHYNKAIEMHSEGQSYKDFVSNLYLLDDDLQNDTSQFYFALERYKINTGSVNRCRKELIDAFKNSYMYNIEKYIVQDENTQYFAEEKWREKNTTIPD